MKLLRAKYFMKVLGRSLDGHNHNLHGEAKTDAAAQDSDS